VYLNLDTNKLTGAFFAFFWDGQCRMTKPFFVQFYAGSIPASLGNLKKLTHLYLYENKLTGPFFHFWDGQSQPTVLFLV